jgi:hypothetical protein
MGEVAIGVAVWGNALVDLEELDPRPVEVVGAEQLEHPPGCTTTADREGEAAPLGDRPGGRLGDQLGADARRLLRVRNDLQPRDRDPGQSFFSS